LIVAVLGLVAQIFPSLRYPFWIWILAFASSMAVVQFLAYHEMRLAYLASDEGKPLEGETAFDLRDARRQTLDALIREFENLKEQVPSLPRSGGNTYYLAWHPVRVRTLANRDLSSAWLANHYPDRAEEFDDA